jgi:plastocyanin
MLAPFKTRGDAARRPKTVCTDDDVHHTRAGCWWIFFGCAMRTDDRWRSRSVKQMSERTRLRGMTHRALALMLLAGVDMAAAGDATPPAAGGAVVQIVDFMRFEPVTLTVSAGTEVTWINNDGSNHIIQLQQGGKSPRLRHGANWAHRFTTPGEYPYICAIHGERMSGTIIVQAP